MKKLKIYLLVLLLFVVQFYYIALPVECSEVNTTEETTVSYTWEYLTNSEGVTVGKLYDGGYEKTSTTIKYPLFYVYITTDGEVLDLTNYNYVMRKYTTTKTGLEKGEYLSDTKPESNNNYFEIDVANDPNLNYWELVIKNEDKTETIIELEEPILGTKAPGEKKL